MCGLAGEWWRVPWAHADLCDLTGVGAGHLASFELHSWRKAGRQASSDVTCGSVIAITASDPAFLPGSMPPASRVGKEAV